MPPPFRIGVMQLTMEPLDEMLESARVMDEAGMDTIWLAEAYPWWRKHGMEARSSTVVSALIARETERLTIGWGIISPFTRHPVQVAMDARVVQEAAGPGRFLLGFGTSKIFLNNAKHADKRDARADARRGRDRARRALGGEEFQYEGDTWSADVPRPAAARRTRRARCRRSTSPRRRRRCRRSRARSRDGCLTPSITTPAFVRYTRENVARDIDIGCTVVASIARRPRRGPRRRARDRRACTSRTRSRTSRAPADTLLELAGIEQEEIRPVAEAMERGGRLAAKEQVTDDAPGQVQADRGHARGLHRRDRGVPRRRLHARDARALGRRAPRADPALRRAGAAAASDDRRAAAWSISRCAWSRRRRFTGSEEACARADARRARRSWACR